uniref:Uncharacterized protein n=1 Tax=Panagrolaimus sp. PS1159 TaxID=55785 RepID=A0AC35FSD2_9BILA
MEEEAAFALAYNGHQQYRMGCIPLFLKPHMWFFSTIELVLSLFGLIFNCAVTVAIYYSIPLSIIQRRSLATLAVNYACISGLHLSRNIFYLVAFHYPCITIVTTINCKLQEFPLVFLYIHGSVLPIILAIQAFLKHKKNHSIISWTNACTIQQTSILILCVFLSLLFTAFDEDKSHEELLQCTIVMALKDKDMTFWLITTLIFGHAAALILIQIVVFCFHKPITFRTFFNQSLRDYFVIESLSWEILLLLTGVFAVYEFVALELCEKCLTMALEITFIIMPLCICCGNPLLIILFILPVKNAAVRLCPKLSNFLPEYQLPTPQLPTPELQPIRQNPTIKLPM